VGPWYERYFTADYWVYAGAEYTAERTETEVDYLAAVLDGTAPGRRVLDVGCGVGRHAVGLAHRGFDVIGVDVSSWALSRAAQAASTAGVSLALHQLDALTAPEWPVEPVDAVVCVQAFGWGTDVQQLQMLRALRQRLVPGGVLVLDHSSVSAILRMYSARSMASVAGHTFEFLRHYDPLTGRSSGTLRVCRPDGTAAELPDDVRLYQPPEVAALLVGAGFEVLRADADFRIGAAVTMDTRYVQFVARSPGWPESALAGHGGTVPAGALNLRWAPDEVSFVDDALAAAWRSVGSQPVDEPIAERARRYDLADPYGARRCTETLVAHFATKLEPAQVTAGAGTTGLLRALAALAVGGTVLVDPLGHPELVQGARELGAAVRAVPLDDAAAAVRAVHTVRPAVTVLDRPGVAGRVWCVDGVRALARAAAETGGVLVVDEACASYLPAGESSVPLTARDSLALVVVRSMSKGYCCGGLRVGFAVSCTELSERVRAVCPPLAVSALSMDVALALLVQGDVLADLRARIAEVRPRFVTLLAAGGIEAQAGDPRLPWVTVDAGATPQLAALGLAGKAVPAAPGGPELVRLSVPLSEARWRAAQAALGGRR
jgi:histidinol-phosphate/aromatic aminotransferase/cobyric acid decarboxylase-like protein/precorrin-6B methylase 2